MTFLVGISIKLTLASAEFNTMASLGSVGVCAGIGAGPVWALVSEALAMRARKTPVAKL